MLIIGNYMTIITLWKQGHSKRTIAKLLGHDRKTVRKIIKNYEEKGIEQPVKLNKSSVVSSYKDEIIRYLEQGLSGVRIFEELQKQNFQGKYRTLCHYIFQLKDRKNICIRFHTAADPAQLDPHLRRATGRCEVAGVGDGNSPVQAERSSADVGIPFDCAQRRLCPRRFVQADKGPQDFHISAGSDLLRLHYFAAAQTGRADTDVLGRGSHFGVNWAQIDVPAPFLP